MKPTALRALADAADALASLARAAADDTDTDDALVSLREAARLAATSVRTLRGAIRAGYLPAYGQTRNRAVRRADLLAWIAGRRSLIAIKGPAGGDIERRMRRLARERRVPQTAPPAPRLRVLGG